MALADIEAVLASKLRGERLTVIDIGRLLLEAKRKVAHGEWLPWLAKHFGKSERSAQNYMNAAEWAAKNATVADLKLRPSALYWLASVDNGQTPDHHREGTRLCYVRDEVEAAVFALAKTKWVDKEDCLAIFDDAARRYSAREKAKERREKSATAEKHRAARAAEREVTLAKLAADKVLQDQLREQQALSNKVIRDGKKEAKLARDEGFNNEAKSRRGNLRGMVGAMIKLQPYVADLVGAVEPEKLEEVVEFFKALVDATIAARNP
jgi:hypothetical protein